MYNDINIADILLENDLNDREKENEEENEMSESFLSFIKSIEKQGVMQPVCIYPINHPTKKYRIIYGRRRCKASIIARRNTIKAKIITDPTPQQIIMLIVDENKQRTGLSDIDDASMHLKTIPIFFNDCPEDFLEYTDLNKIKSGLYKLSSYINYVNQKNSSKNHEIEKNDIYLIKGFDKYFASMQISFSTLKRKARILSFNEQIKKLLTEGKITSADGIRLSKILKEDKQLFQEIFETLKNGTFSKKEAAREISTALVSITPDTVLKIEHGHKRLQTAIGKHKKLKKTLNARKLEQYNYLVGRIENLLKGEKK